MAATMEDDDDDPPEITIRLASTGETFALDPSRALWRDMEAYCAVTGLTVEELINKALADFLDDARDRL